MHCLFLRRGTPALPPGNISLKLPGLQQIPGSAVSFSEQYQNSSNLTYKGCSEL